ncbi:MAG TPA: hypothetical protein VF204_08070 [Streptosporangiaceae bacterium]
MMQKAFAVLAAAAGHRAVRGLAALSVAALSTGLLAAAASPAAQPTAGNHPATLTGFCQRTITAGGITADFRQNFDLPLHQGWNPVVADFSIPQPGHIVANLELGTGQHEKWYFFTPAAP